MVLSCFTAKKLRSCNIRFGVFSSFLSLLDIAICKMLLLCKRSGLQHCWLTRKFTASWWRVPWQNLEFFYVFFELTALDRTALETEMQQDRSVMDVALFASASACRTCRRTLRRTCRMCHGTGDPGRASARSQASDVDQLSQLLGEPQNSEPETIHRCSTHSDTM